MRQGAQNGISFDPKTTKVMYFPRNELRTAPAVRRSDVKKHPVLGLCWLGLWLGSRLLFQIYVEKRATKAKAVTYYLKGLANIIHSSLPSAI